MKACKTCGQIKPLTAFPVAPQNTDGRYGSCRECRNALTTEWRARNLEHVRKQQREWKRSRYVPHPRQVQSKREPGDYGFKAQRVTPPTSERDRAYMAGIFDGEGNLTAIKKSPTSFPIFQLSVANTDRELMEWLAQFGGKVRIHGRAGTGTHRRTKDCYMWRVTGTRDVEAILRALLAYLIVKHGIAVVALAEIEAYRPRRRDVVGSECHAPSVMEIIH